MVVPAPFLLLDSAGDLGVHTLEPGSQHSLGSTCFEASRKDWHPGRRGLCREEGACPGRRGLSREQGGAFSVIGVALFAPSRHESSSPIYISERACICASFGGRREEPHPEPTHSLPSHSECVTHQDLLAAAMSIPSGNGYSRALSHPQ